MAILVLGFLNSYYTRLAFASATLIVFEAALSLTSARSADIIVATARYGFNFSIFFKYCDILIFFSNLGLHLSWVPFCREVHKASLRVTTFFNESNIHMSILKYWIGSLFVS